MGGKMKRLLKYAAVIMGLGLMPASAAFNPANVPAVATIAALRAIPVTAAPQYTNIIVQDYYGTGSGCPIQYKWNASDSTADDGGGVINPTGNAGAGRWNQNVPAGSPVHTCTFGVKPDNSTDNYTQLQAALTWANSAKINVIHIDGKQGGGSGTCTYAIKFGTTLTPYEGQIIQGDGAGSASSTAGWGGTCLSFTNTSGWALQTLSVQSGVGTTPFEAPKFRDLAIYTPSSTTAGGCIRLNAISGGFTDDTTTQQYMMHPEIRNVLCYMGFITNNGQIGFQCSKCFDGTVFHSDFINGLNGIDLEGSDNIVIEGGCRISNTYGSFVKFVAQGTFGNNNTLQNCQLLSIADTGASQTVDSLVYNAARTSVIANNLFEATAPSGGSITSQIRLVSGFSASIRDNSMTASATNWLKVDSDYQNITATNNGSAGTNLSSATFGASAGSTYLSSSVLQTLTHYGNGQGDGGWPFNTVKAVDVVTVPSVQLTWTPSMGGLQYSSIGTTEKPSQNRFTFGGTGGSNYLDFRRDVGYLVTGTFDIQVHAWMTGGSGTLTCQVTDNGSLAGSSQNASLTTAPTWFTLVTNQAVATDAGVRCWSDSTSALLAQINLVNH